MNEVENFLESHTFICTVFQGRMSKKQCDYQCARVVRIMREPENINELSDWRIDKCLKCMSCAKFTPPTQETTDMLSNTCKRYAVSEDGKTDRDILSYVEASNWRKKNDS